ncbi:uncharacterized protein LOC130764142 isoform X2 [Actinidia eriantha]|uniref:uncharacterized protein LOC130764142 isoform X2 n=1 Tax=Actinidia eriantha TaxID=165200 RepID=UPI002590A528|nr:uncharacterized protein LOC130764142 isoform X2 [Actinidia eriantha]
MDATNQESQLNWGALVRMSWLLPTNSVLRLGSRRATRRSTAHNMAGPNEVELIEQWDEANDVAPLPLSETRNFWQGHRILSFLLACMVFAFCDLLVVSLQRALVRSDKMPLWRNV